jgi:polyhydroxybutyrate depolymerase
MTSSRVTIPAVLLVVLAVVATSCSEGSERSAPSTTGAQSPPSSPSSSSTSAPAQTTTATTAPTPTPAPATTAVLPSTVVSSTTVSTTTALPVCSDLPIGVTEFDLTAGGADHPVRVFVPSAYTGVALPAVVNWHGLGGDGPTQAGVTLYEGLAETQGFIAVHPTGVPSATDSRNSWQLAPATGERDDVVFANELLDHLIADWCADADRLYSIGVSNGGFFAARLMCEMADRLAAVVSVAGLYHPDGCSPSRPVPYLAYHGTDDMIVPFDGDGGSVLTGVETNPALRVFVEQVMPAEFAEFAADAGCDLAPTVLTIDDVIRYDYIGCDDAVPMSFFEITGGGHTWPNWPIADVIDPVMGATTDTVDATIDSWEFFRQHSLSD